MKVKILGLFAAVFLLSASQVIAGPFRLLLESDADRPGGTEVFFLTHNSYADVLAHNVASQQFGAIDINPLFSVGGFTSEFAPQVPGVPEPGTLLLFVLGALGLGLVASTQVLSALRFHYSQNPASAGFFIPAAVIWPPHAGRTTE